MLTTVRLQLRPWRWDDLDDAIALWTDARVMKLLSKTGAMTREQIEARLAHEIATQESFGYQYWHASTRSDGRFIGCCGLKNTDVDGDRVLEMGFHLAHDAWGRGFATEAARGAVGHAFTSLRAPALYAGHHPENEGSRRVLTKLGFVLVGKRLFPPTGLDHPWYVLGSQPAAPPDHALIPKLGAG